MARKQAAGQDAPEPINADGTRDSDRTYVVVHLSQAMKDAIGAYATQHNVSGSALVREAIATKIGFDLSSAPTRERQKKYATPEDRTAAQRKRYQEKRATERAVLDAIMKQAKAKDVAALRAWLESQGMNPDS